MEHFQSGQQKENIAAVGHSISSYTTSLKTKCKGTTRSKGIAAILAMPLTSEKEADDFLVEMKGLKWGLERDNVTFDVPRFANWQVAGYLENKDNQRREGWPEVLGIWCRTYIELLTANMMLKCLADPQTLDRRINETQANDNSLPNLTKNTKRECHKALLNLKWLADKLPESWESDKKEMLKIVQAVRPAARERGMYAHVGYWDDDKILYTASGSGSKDPLKWKYQDETAWLNSISIHIPNAEKDSFTPKYEVFTCERDNKIGRHTLDSITNTLSKCCMGVISPRPNERFLDVSAMAAIVPRSGVSSAVIGQNSGADPSKPAKAYVTLITEDKNKNNYVNLYVIDEDDKSKREEVGDPKNPWQPGVSGAKDLRSLYLPPTTLPDDPDADLMFDNNAKPPGPPLLAQNPNIFLFYTGVRDSNYIFAGYHPDPRTGYYSSTTLWTIEGPENWTSYNGIEVDPHYLWVFGKDGIACATHASIIKHMQGKIASGKLPWFYHDFDKQLFPSPPEVTSLFPCADGTLVTNIQGNIYTADYDVVRARFLDRRIVTSSWVKRGGKAKQVIKMPIPCWSMLESLRENLQSG